MCRSMIDIQSATAGIRRGKKKDRKKPRGKNIMSASATQSGHNNFKNMDQYQYFLVYKICKESIFSVYLYYLWDFMKQVPASIISMKTIYNIPVDNCNRGSWSKGKFNQSINQFILTFKNFRNRQC